MIIRANAPANLRRSRSPARSTAWLRNRTASTAHDADEMPLEIFEIVDLKPARQRNGFVRSNGADPENGYPN